MPSCTVKCSLHFRRITLGWILVMSYKIVILVLSELRHLCALSLSYISLSSEHACLVLSLSSSSFSLDSQLCADTRVYVGRAQSTVEVHGRDGEASCSTRTTTQHFYRPMPLLSLYLVLSLSSSSFSLDRQLTSHVLGVLYAVPYPYLVVRMRMYA